MDGWYYKRNSVRYGYVLGSGLYDESDLGDGDEGGRNEMRWRGGVYNARVTILQKKEQKKEADERKVRK